MKSVRVVQAVALLGVTVFTTRASHAQNAPLRVLGYTTTVPATWIAHAAASTMRLAEYRGTYAWGVGAGNAANAQPNQTLIAGIAETPRGTLFIQLFGPSALVASARQDFIGFVRGLH